MRLPRAVPVVLAALGLAVAAGCGAVGDGADAALEESVAGAVRERIDADPSLAALRQVDCARTGAEADCVVDLDLAAHESVVRVAYAVRIAADGCWSAQAVRVEQLGAGAGVEPERGGGERLAGCIG